MANRRNKLTKKQLATKIKKYNATVLSKQPPQKAIDKAKRIARRQRQRNEAEANARHEQLMRIATGEVQAEVFGG